MLNGSRKSRRDVLMCCVDCAWRAATAAGCVVKVYYWSAATGVTRGGGGGGGGGRCQARRALARCAEKNASINYINILIYSRSKLRGTEY